VTKITDIQEEIVHTNTTPDTRVVVRIFVNGQYMTTCKMVDVLGTVDGDFVLDADLEIFEMEKK